MTINDRAFVTMLISSSIVLQVDSIDRAISRCLVFVVTAFLMAIIFREGKSK